MTSRECIEVALALQTIAYHDKNYLDKKLASDTGYYNTVISALLKNAIKIMDDNDMRSL